MVSLILECFWLFFLLANFIKKLLQSASFVFQKNQTIAGFPGASQYIGSSLLEEECDILCPCAIENVIDAENAPKIKAKIIAEGANGPTTFEANEILLKRKVFVEVFVLMLQLQ